MGGKNSQTTVLLEVKGDDPWLEYSLQSLLGFGGGVKVTLNTEKRPFLNHRRETKETKLNGSRALRSASRRSL